MLVLCVLMLQMSQMCAIVVAVGADIHEIEAREKFLISTVPMWIRLHCGWNEGFTVYTIFSCVP